MSVIQGLAMKQIQCIAKSMTRRIVLRESASAPDPLSLVAVDPTSLESISSATPTRTAHGKRTQEDESSICHGRKRHAGAMTSIHIIPPSEADRSDDDNDDIEEVKDVETQQQYRGPSDHKTNAQHLHSACFDVRSVVLKPATLYRDDLHWITNKGPRMD